MKLMITTLALFCSTLVLAESIEYTDFKPVGGKISGYQKSEMNNGVIYEYYQQFQFHCSQMKEDKCVEIQPVIHTFTKKNGIDTNSHRIYESEFNFPRYLPFSFLENAVSNLKNQDFLDEYHNDLTKLLRKQKDFACWMCITKTQIDNLPMFPIWALIIYAPFVATVIAPVDAITYAATYHIKQKQYLKKMSLWNNQFLEVAENLFKNNGNRELTNVHENIVNHLWFKNLNMLIKYLDEGEF